MPETAFQPGEPVQWVTIEGGFNSRRMVTYQQAASDHAAVVAFGHERLTVLVSELSRVEPANKPPPWLDKWFEPAKPPSPIGETALDSKLAERRATLAQRQEHAKQAQAKQTAARQIAERAGREVQAARATLATLDAHDRAEQRNFELAIASGKPLPQRSNGTDRGYLKARVDAAEQAQQRFDRELSEATAGLGDALSAIRRAAADVVATLLERETENLRAAEAHAALLRAELTAVAGWFPSAEIGLLKVDRATAACLQAPLAWSDQPGVRSRSGWLKGWQKLWDQLCQDHQADFTLSGD